MLVTEFMDQGSLQDIISRGVLDVFKTWDISYDILMGLQFLHSLNHIHRDIKPANIVVSYSKGLQAKIAGILQFARVPACAYLTIRDFGSNRDLGKDRTLTPLVMGTLKCMEERKRTGRPRIH